MNLDFLKENSHSRYRRQTDLYCFSTPKEFLGTKQLAIASIYSTSDR
ncbi:hypothetical protein [Nostoc sp.]